MSLAGAPDEAAHPGGATLTDYLALGLVALLPLVMTFSHRAAAPVLILLAAINVTRLPLRAGRLSLADRLTGFTAPTRYGVVGSTLLIVLALYTVVSGVISPTPGAMKLGVNVVTPVFAAAVFGASLSRLSVAARASLCRVTALAVFAGAVLLAFEAATGGLLRQLTPPVDTSWNGHKDWAALGRGTTILVALVFPALSIMRRGGQFSIIAIIMMAATGYAAARFGIQANLFAFAAGLAAYLLAAAAPRSAISLLLLAWLAGLVTAPLLAFLPTELLVARFEGVLPASALQRLVVWQAVADAVPAHFPWGAGADATRALTETSRTIEIKGGLVPLKVFPTHPHNVFLQLWYELGLPGVLLAAGAITTGFAAAARLVSQPASLEQKALSASVCGVLAATLVSFLVEASLWQVWRLSTLGLALVFCLLTAGPNKAAIGAAEQNGSRDLRS